MVLAWKESHYFFLFLRLRTTHVSHGEGALFCLFVCIRMIPHKKRQSYKKAAIQLAKENHRNLDPNNWEQIWNLLDEFSIPSYIYVIGEPFSNIVKIGKSTNPGLRLKQLQTGSPTELKLWGFCREKSPLTEKEIHEKLKAFRLHGEHFTVSSETQTIISDIRKSSYVCT